MRNEETIELEHMAAKSQTQNEWSVEPEGNTERVECRTSGLWRERERNTEVVECRTSGVWREREKHRSCGVWSQRETQNVWRADRVECGAREREREKHRSCGVRSQRERHTKLNTLGE